MFCSCRESRWFQSGKFIPCVGCFIMNEHEDTNSLEELRGKIDSVDNALLLLLDKRAKYARKIGKIKTVTKIGGAIYRPEREAKLVRQLLKKNISIIKNESIVRIFKEIISACRAEEGSPSIAYLGPPGTFSHMAASRHFGHAAKVLSMRTVEDIFEAVQTGRCDYGVIPIENSRSGTVGGSIDCFCTYSPKIVGEIELSISQCLLSKESSMASIDTVYSHVQSLAQCNKWLDNNLPHCRIVECISNGDAASRASRAIKAAAIAGRQLAELYPLRVLETDIQDHTKNITRFFVIGKEYVVVSGDDSTSILVSVENKSGRLSGLLSALSKRGINITHIESRPSAMNPWEYIFFLEMRGHCSEANIKQGLDEVKAKSVFFKLLGSYPSSLTD